MADDGNPTGPTEGAGGCRRPKLPEWLRDRTGEVAGSVFVGGLPPSLLDELEARDADESEGPSEREGRGE